MSENEIISLAEQYVEETGVSIFLTGKAGTGKTTFLRHVFETTQKRRVVLAPTGVAAINAGGQTIHSFFQLPLCPYLPDLPDYPTEYQMPDRFRKLKKDRIKIIRTLELLIIDEISMVRADLLDAVDMTLRKYRHNEKPFGGVQLLMIGDAQQLSPVVTDAEKPFISQVYPSPYFFESKALKRLPYLTIELTHIFRQKDADFVALLNDVRSGNPSSATLKTLNSRLNPSFDPDNSEGWIRLTTHNYQAARVNDAKLAALPGNLVVFNAIIDGNFPQNAYPAQEELPLKRGEQVMFIRNDTSGKQRYFNGRIGIVHDIEEDCVLVKCKTQSGDEEIVDVQYETWTNIQYSMNPKTGEIEQHEEGSFSQIPLRAAWAVTIHKSQGLTFDRVIIDASEAFAFGQVYVALSRCTSLEGIVLSSPVNARSLVDDKAVSQFTSAFTPPGSLAKELPRYHDRYVVEMLRECFSFESLSIRIDKVRQIFAESLSKTYPAQLSELVEDFNSSKEMEEVGRKFSLQLSRLTGQNEKLDERARKAAVYFIPLLNRLNESLTAILSIEVDNKETTKQLREQGSEVMDILCVKREIMPIIVLEGFTINAYQKAKLTPVITSANTQRSTTGRKSREKKERKPKAVRPDYQQIYKDNHHPELVEKLMGWRTEKFRELGVPAYVVLTQKALLSIADAAPQSLAELRHVYGVGPTTVSRYGEEILQITCQV